MPTVTPPTPASSVAPAAATGGVTPVEAGVANTPDKLQQLARQIQVSGLITQPPEGGEITLSTVVGNLTILLPQLAKDQQDKLIQQLTSLFQSQRPLTVVVQPGNPPAQAFLLLPPTTPAANATSIGVAQTNVLFQTVTTQQPVTPGAVLPAVVLPPSLTPPNISLPPVAIPQALTSGITLPAAPSLDELSALTDLEFLGALASKAEAMLNEIMPEAQARILSDAYIPPGAQPTNFVPASSPSLPGLPQAPSAAPLTPPSVTGAPVTPQTIPVAPDAIPAALETLPALPTAAAQTAAPQVNIPPPLAALFQPGAEVSLQVDAVALPGAPLPVPSGPNQILATVTGSGPSGNVLVQAGDTTLYIKQTVNMPVGSTLLVTVGAARAEPLMPLPLPDMGNFNTLQQALVTLAQADPQLARQVMEDVIPQPNEALGGALMFLLSAVGQGNIRGWLGNNAVDILTRAGKMELIARLSQQLNEGGQLAQDPVVGAWRSYTVPLHANNQFQTLHLYVHGDGRDGGKKGDDGKPGANAVRFLIDMRLSRLGALQLDGFVRPRKLDMIVRSERVLPQGLSHDLRQTYIKTLDAVGYVGGLSFQTGRQSWLTVRKTAGPGSVVT